jgi:rhamnosyltransferase
MLADLVPRLVQKGYRVRCSCEKPANGTRVSDYEGATLDFFALKPPANYTLRKVFELLYDFFFVLKYALICDVVYVLGIYGGAALLFPRLLGREVVVNTDGLEWERPKYRLLERSLIILFYAISLNLASKIVIDNTELRRFIGERHNSKICYIPYGVSSQKQKLWNLDKLHRYVSKQPNEGTIEPGKYWLVISRLEPENNIYLIVKGFIEANPSYPLLVVGDFTGQAYKKQVKGVSKGSSATVFFLGAIYDSETLWMLRQHCLGYLHGHSVGGTNPSLLEAMTSGNLILAHDNPFNREVCGPFACYFSTSADVSNLIASTEKNPESSLRFRRDVYERAAAFSWEDVEERYHKLFKGDDRAVKDRCETETHFVQESKQ